MAGNLNDVMDAMGAALGTIDGLRVFDFPPKSAQPPFAFVDMPESIDYDLALQRGYDSARFTVVVGVADVVDRAGRDAIGAYAAGSGASSVKAVLEAATDIGDTLRVESVDFRPVTIASGTYAGAIFTVHVVF